MAALPAYSGESISIEMRGGDNQAMAVKSTWQNSGIAMAYGIMYQIVHHVVACWLPTLLC